VISFGDGDIVETSVVVNLSTVVMYLSSPVWEIIEEAVSVTFFVKVDCANEVVAVIKTVLEIVTMGIEPVGWTVEVTVDVMAISPATKGRTLTAVRLIQVVLEKNVPIWKARASLLDISLEKVALPVRTAPGPVFWYSAKNTLSVFGVLLDYGTQPTALTELSKDVLIYATLAFAF